MKANTENTELQVVQKNTFIQRYQKQLVKLSFNDMLVLKTIVSKVNAKDTLFKECYTVTHAELDRSGFRKDKNRRSSLLDSLEKLSSVYFNVKAGEDLIRCGLLKNRFVYAPYSKEFKIEMYPEMSNFLLDIKEQFTKYPLAVLANLTNKYDLLLFEYFLSISKLGQQKISLEKLKELLGVEDKYKRTPLFKRELLDKSISRINEHTNINVKYTEIMKKNKVTGFIFHIKSVETFSVKKYLKSIIGRTLDIKGDHLAIIEIKEVQDDFNTLYKISVENALGLKGFIQNDFTIDELKAYITINLMEIV